MRAQAREGAQLLTNQLYSLLGSSKSRGVIKLPEPTTQLPREKPLPKPKPLTRWEKFAKDPTNRFDTRGISSQELGYIETSLTVEPP